MSLSTATSTSKTDAHGVPLDPKYAQSIYRMRQLYKFSAKRALQRNYSSARYQI